MCSWPVQFARDPLNTSEQIQSDPKSKPGWMLETIPQPLIATWAECQWHAAWSQNYISIHKRR